MFCTECGQKLENDVKFCPNCGTKIENGSNETVNPKEKYLKSVFSFNNLGIFNNEVLEEMLANGIFLTEEEIKTAVDEHNKKAGLFGKKTARGVIMEYNNRVKKFNKKTEENTKVLGISKEEFEALTPFEKAQLNIMLEQQKKADNTNKQLAMMNLAQGFRGL